MLDPATNSSEFAFAIMRRFQNFFRCASAGPSALRLVAGVLLSVLALAGTQTGSARDSTFDSSSEFNGYLPVVPRPAPPGTGPSSSRLHVVSYNIKGLPGILVGPRYKSRRYSIIGARLAERGVAAPDVVLLQEGFSGDTRKLIELSGFPHVSRGPRASPFFGVDSGLYILSRYPIVAEDQMTFGSENCQRWDCFANKGAQFVRIVVPGLPVLLEVFNTHLQAGRDNSPSRARQVELLVDFYRRNHVAGNPVIFGGDFNFRPLVDRDAYDAFVLGTGLGSSGRFCLDRGCARPGNAGTQGIWEDSVDHQFYSLDSTVPITPVRLERRLGEPVEGSRLSDHLTHEVVFELAAARAAANAL
jgi:endonuclease/exonuclease/phosphatase family metal-dependent hydrolase